MVLLVAVALALHEVGHVRREAAASLRARFGRIVGIDAAAARTGFTFACGVVLAIRILIAAFAVRGALLALEDRGDLGVVKAAGRTLAARLSTSSSLSRNAEAFFFLSAAKGVFSKPVAITVIFTSSFMFSSMPAPKMMLASGSAACGDELRGLVDVDDGGVRCRR